ncbi:hypothetical protein ACHAQH_000866 [Verticillium albo-atrum]
MSGPGTSNLKSRTSQPNRLTKNLLSNVSELSTDSVTPPMAADSDVSSVRRRKARLTTRPFKFRPPTVRFRSRRPSQNLNNSPYMSPGPYHSDDNHIESEPEFRWSSSNLSISTDATSIPSDDATTKSSPGRQLVRARSVPGRDTVGLRQKSQQNRQPGRVGLTLPDGRGRTYHISVAPGPLQDSPTPARAKLDAPAPQTKGKGGRNKRKGDGPLLRQIETLKGEIKTLQDNQSSISSHGEAATTRSRSASRHKGEEKLLQQVEDLKDEVKSLQDGQSSTARDLENALDKLSVIKAEKDDIQRRLAEASAPSSIVRGFDHQYQMVDDAQSSFSSHSQRSRSASKGRQDLPGLQQAKTDLETKVAELEKDLTLYKDFKVCLEAKCEELQDEIKQQEELFKADSERLRTDVDDVEDLRKTQDTAHIARIVSLELQKESLEAKTDALEAEIARKDFEYGDFTTERDQLSKDKEAWVEEKKSLESRVEVLEGEKSKLEEQTKALEETIKGLETARNDIQAHVAEVEQANEELQSKVGGLEDDKSTIVSQVRSLEGKSDKLKTKVDRLKGENGNLRTQVSSLLKDQDDHTSQVLTLSAERDGLKEENVTLKAMSEAGSVMGSVVGSRTGRWVASEMGSQAPSEVGSVASKAPTEVGSTVSKTSSKLASEVGSTVSKASKASSTASKKSNRSGSKASSSVGSRAPSQVGSLASVKEEVNADDNAATTVSDATEKPDDKASEVSAQPASDDSSAPDIIEVTVEESEVGDKVAEPDAATEEAPAPEPEQAALLATLQTQNADLETRNATLQEEAARVEALTTERDDLASRLATAEQDAAQVPTLRQENGGLVTQLVEVNAALEGAMAAHAAANEEVDGLKAEVVSLRSRISSPSRRSGSTRTSRKDGERSKQLVVVRDPNDRGQM